MTTAAWRITRTATVTRMLARTRTAARTRTPAALAPQAVLRIILAAKGDLGKLRIESYLV